MKLFDPQRALELREQGFTWRAIGRILATENDRRMPYTKGGMITQIKKWKAKDATGGPRSVRGIKSQPNSGSSSESKGS